MQSKNLIAETNLIFSSRSLQHPPCVTTSHQCVAVHTTSYLIWNWRQRGRMELSAERRLSDTSEPTSHRRRHSPAAFAAIILGAVFKPSQDLIQRSSRYAYFLFSRYRTLLKPIVDPNLRDESIKVATLITTQHDEQSSSPHSSPYSYPKVDTGVAVPWSALAAAESG